VSDPSASEFEMGDAHSIEDLVDREALGEVCRSFFDLFGLSIRVFNQTDALLADVHQQRAICGYVNSLEAGRPACAKVVGDVRKLAPEHGDQVHPCFTGATYRVVPILYDGRRLGRFVVGPYLPAELKEVPRALLQIDGQVDQKLAREHLSEMPRVRRETAEKISTHLTRVIDVILFNGHRALLTSSMHLASVRANYRELSEKNRRLQLAHNKLKELDRLKSNFLATMSHELRTPLTSVIGYAEMLASGVGGPLTQDHQEFVEIIRNKSNHLFELITSLLDMSKFERGEVPLFREPVDVDHLIADVIRTVAPMAGRKEIHMRSELELDLPRIHADPDRLRQVLQNLTDNALKFTAHGGEVVLSARTVDMRPGADLDEEDDNAGLVLMMAPRRGVQIAVRDSGIGIPASEHARIFDAFYQVDSSATREHGGTGLGLSIVKRLVEAHGGTVRLKSASGKGSTFFLTIPESE
jgi:two-component system sensor histidine kinase BarA